MSLGTKYLCCFVDLLASKLNGLSQLFEARSSLIFRKKNTDENWLTLQKQIYFLPKKIYFTIRTILFTIVLVLSHVGNNKISKITSRSSVVRESV